MPGFVLQLGHPSLREHAVEIETIDDSIVSLSKKMNFIMKKEDGIGLAAPQIGILKRIFTYNLGGNFTTIINPRIVEMSDKQVYLQEGCLSVRGFYFNIERATKAHIKGLNLDGEEIDIEAEGLLARLFQHEVDHLDGVLLVDYLEDKDAQKFFTKWTKKRRK